METTAKKLNDYEKSILNTIYICLVGSTQTQKLSKIEEVLQSKQKWTSMNMKSKRPYFEIGETFTIRIDRKFYHDRNNYAKLVGDWSLDGKKLILTYYSFTEERRRIPYVYTIKNGGKMDSSFSIAIETTKKKKLTLNKI